MVTLDFVLMVGSAVMFLMAVLISVVKPNNSTFHFVAMGLLLWVLTFLV